MCWTSVRDCFPEKGVECLHELHASRWLVRRMIGYCSGWGVGDRDRLSRTAACACSTLDAAGVGS
jgi:hypothetical protein